MDDLYDFGPQYRQDSPFMARMRFHQSWYRAHVLNVPYGVGPKVNNKTLYGNMLTLEDGEKGLTFLRPHIFEVARRRTAESKGTLDRFSLLCNMLSSQAMGFNLFGPLVDDVELATALLSAWLPGEIERVDKVHLVHTPEAANRDLNDRMAFDVYVEYTRLDRSKAFIGIDTSLTANFSQKSFTQPTYWSLTKAPGSPWPESSWPRLVEGGVNQIWREHMLAIAQLRQPKSRFAAGHFLALFHPLDEAAVLSLRTYQSLVTPEDQTFSTFPLDRLLDLWAKTATRETDQEWLSHFNLRYLDLSASEDEFQAFLSGKKN